MKQVVYYFPIDKVCVVKGCKNNVSMAFLELSGTHPMNLEMSGFSYLCKEHKDSFDKYKIGLTKKKVGLV
jgi:hypothetical protein